MGSHQERYDGLASRLAIVAVVVICLVFALSWVLDRPEVENEVASTVSEGEAPIVDERTDDADPAPVRSDGDPGTTASAGAHAAPVEQVEKIAVRESPVATEDASLRAEFVDDTPNLTITDASEEGTTPDEKPSEELAAPGGMAETDGLATAESSIAEPGAVNEAVDAEVPWAERLRGALATERSQVNDAIASDEGSHSREDLLAMYGGSSAASGRFGRAAAAYSLFIEENGYDHPYSERILTRLCECLLPLDMRSMGISHTPEGPRFEPTWKMNYTPSEQHMVLAIGAYEASAAHASSNAAKAKALLALGWAHLAMNDWAGASVAWERCVDVAGNTKTGADALWHIAKNLTWTGRPQAAASEFHRFAERFPSDARTTSAKKRAMLLEAQARRTNEWFEDPVVGLEAEIADHAGILTPLETYTDVSRWLKHRNETQALIAIGRWACAQADWPVVRRIVAHNTVADELLTQPAASEADRREAADRLNAIVGLAPSDDWAIAAGLKRASILSELGDFAAADATLDTMNARIGDDKRWYPNITLGRVQSLLDRGHTDAAETLLTQFREAYPDYPLSPQYASIIDNRTRNKQGAGE